MRDFPLAEPTAVAEMLSHLANFLGSNQEDLLNVKKKNLALVNDIKYNQ